MKGAFYLDAGVAYDVTDQISIYAKMDNVTDTDPEPNPSLAPNNPGVNPLLYDTVGRRWRLGVRATF
jgi:outer membrane receptor protein involved in Fe transport